VNYDAPINEPGATIACRDDIHACHKCPVINFNTATKLFNNGCSTAGGPIDVMNSREKTNLATEDALQTLTLSMLYFILQNLTSSVDLRP
jgi:hypothetical protein